MRQAEQAAFRDFVAERGPALLRTAFLLTGDRGRAEDLLQTALERVYRRWGRLGRGSMDYPHAYVRRTLANLATDCWRRRVVLIEEPTAELPDIALADSTDAVDARQVLWTALLSLPQRQRAVLVLRYWEDLSEAETAAVLSCSAGTVKSQASRGLRRLRDSLSVDEENGAPDECISGN